MPLCYCSTLSIFRFEQKRLFRQAEQNRPINRFSEHDQLTNQNRFSDQNRFMEQNRSTQNTDYDRSADQNRETSRLGDQNRVVGRIGERQRTEEQNRVVGRIGELNRDIANRSTDQNQDSNTSNFRKPVRKLRKD